MLVRFRFHLASNAISYVALFFALTGTAYAAVGKDTVGSLQIINGSIKRGDLATSATTRAYGTHKTEATTSNGPAILLAQDLSAGSYVIVAKLTIAYSADPQIHRYKCRLRAGPAADEVDIQSGGAGGIEPVTLVVLHSSTEDFSAS